MHAVDGVPMAKLAAKHRFDVSKLKYKVKVISSMEKPLLPTGKKNAFIRERKNSRPSRPC